MSEIPVSVVLVEDDDDLRDGLNEILTMSGYNVTAVASGRAMYQALDTSDFMIAILDIGLPDQSGLVLAEYLRKNTETRIIILTARDDEEHQLKGYDSGADIYLTKPVSGRVLVSAVARLTERFTSQATGGEATPAIWTLHKRSWSLKNPEGSEVALTAQEFKLLEILVGSPQQLASRDTIQQQLFEQPADDSSRALDALVRRLRVKLNSVTNAAELVRSIYGYGYRLCGLFKVMP